MPSGAADVWARLWPEGELREIDDDGRLFNDHDEPLLSMVPTRRLVVFILLI